jgi:hypothetical protein
MCVAAVLILAGDEAPAQNAPQIAPPAAYTPYSNDDLESMVAPVALYPDALLAQVLVACTYPDDVIAAAKWEDAGGVPAAIDSQPWDSSVKGVARDPDVLHYLARNADWMNTLGAAFLNQPDDVTAAVQLLRAKALAAGTLVSNQYQTVINNDGYIQIIPADGQTLYVPTYDPNVAFEGQQYDAGDLYQPCESFGEGIDVGDWLDYDVDWYDGAVYFGHWGKDRPWWHDHDRGRDVRETPYLDNRPGRFTPFGGAVGPGEHVAPGVQVGIGRWTRDVQKPPPRAILKPRPVQPLDRPDRGYGPGGGEEPGMPTYGGGIDAGRQGDRGRESRQNGAPAPRPAPIAPRERPPVPREPAPSPEPRRYSPPIEARPSAPMPGGAMGGYERGGDAGAASARGAGSRGGGGRR